MYKYIFGPVPSRRLGISLGIDLVPYKVCSLDCVYCEVGKTTDLTNERREYYSPVEIIDELRDWLENNPDPDYITFSGSGEPTLNTGIPQIIHFIKNARPSIPVAMLTNGTLLSRKEVRLALKDCDVVLPSLDAATQTVFEKINRPSRGLKVEDCIAGLVDFRREYSGEIRLEVFILPGYNDDDAELKAIKKAIEEINPDSVELNSLDRPGVLSGLEKASRKELQRIVDLWGLRNVSVVSKALKRKDIQSYNSDIEQVILSTISRRPCTADDLREIPGLHKNELNKYLDVLEGEETVITVREKRGIFYKIKN